MKKLLSSILMLGVVFSSISGCAVQPANSVAGSGWEPQDSMELQYAQNFSVDYFEGGYKLISICDGSRFLLVPEGMEAPKGIDSDITVLYQPVDHIYMAATSAMCLFDAVNCLSSISLSGTKAEGWYNHNAQVAMEKGTIRFAGKYSEPDYELILSDGCKLAVESTMIERAPEVKEKLMELGIPVFVDQSSYEPHPLGHTEWIKLYAALFNKEAVAQELFDEQVAFLKEIANMEPTGKPVAFFYINTSGNAIVRRPGDYVTKMIELAGGDSVFDDAGDSQSDSTTLEMEAFYAVAKDADFIIYNCTVGGELETINELVSKNALLKDFKAVQRGNVWCTRQNLFQETTRLGQMILDINRMLTVPDPSLTKFVFLYKLQ